MPGPPPNDVATIESWCERRVPAHVRDQVRVEAIVDGNRITIVERRPPLLDEFGPEWITVPVARLRYVHKDRQWRLRWCDRNERWHRYDSIEPTPDVFVLLEEVERDPAALFWG